jgi:hypothetical protein
LCLIFEELFSFFFLFFYNTFAKFLNFAASTAFSYKRGGSSSAIGPASPTVYRPQVFLLKHNPEEVPKLWDSLYNFQGTIVVPKYSIIVDDIVDLHGEEYQRNMEMATTWTLPLQGHSPRNS